MLEEFDADARRKRFVAKSQDLTISLLLATMVLLFFFLALWREGGHDFSLVYSDLSLPYDNIESVVYWTGQGLLSLGILLCPSILGHCADCSFCEILPRWVLYLRHFRSFLNWQRINFFHAANFERGFGSRSLIRHACNF